jgi:hypothetical protein
MSPGESFWKADAMWRSLIGRALNGIALGLLTVSTCSAACFLSPVTDKYSGETVLQSRDKRESITLANVRAFDDCASLVVSKGVAVAQYLDKSGKLKTEALTEGKGVAADQLTANAAPVRAVSRSLLAVLTDPKERKVPGQKFFDKPAQVGAPFGEIYIPLQGLAMTFVVLEGDARVQIVDATSNAVLVETAAARGLTLQRKDVRAAGKYIVRVLSIEKIPPGAFEVVADDVSAELDEALAGIDGDKLLDENTRPIARALVFEREGLSFNRLIALQGMKR